MVVSPSTAAATRIGGGGVIDASSMAAAAGTFSAQVGIVPKLRGCG
jgi:hypothetical protein